MPPSGVSASVVIVTYNGCDLLGSCLDATLLQTEEVGAEVIVVDNASNDGTVEYLREHFPRVVLVRSQRNVGFAEGCNIGVRAALGNPIVLLNNDAIPDPGWLRELLAALEPDDVAVACSVVHDARFPEDYALGTGSFSVIGHPIPNVGPDLEHPFYATGCALAFKRELIGVPFEPLFFAYYEDALLSWRARMAGYRVGRATRSSVQHLGSVTARRRPDLSTYYYERNKLLTLLLVYERPTLLRLLPLYGFDGVVRLVEDSCLLLKTPAHASKKLAATANRYRLVLSGIAWLAQHMGTMMTMRQRVQRSRRVSDVHITPLLSAKIYDDVVHTRGHTIANAIARWYCRVAGIATAETADAAPRDPIQR